MIKIIDAQIVQLAEKLKQKHLTLVTAESCTGGGLAYYISSSPSCSPLLERGYVTYSNASKQELLAVKPETLQMEGPVSEATAIEMAEGALNNSCAQISISTTGFTGAENKKSSHTKGTVWIACAGIDRKTMTKLVAIKGKRKEFSKKTIGEALKLLLHFLE